MTYRGIPNAVFRSRKMFLLLFNSWPFWIDRANFSDHICTIFLNDWSENKRVPKYFLEPLKTTFWPESTSKANRKLTRIGAFDAESFSLSAHIRWYGSFGLLSVIRCLIPPQFWPYFGTKWLFWPYWVTIRTGYHCAFSRQCAIQCGLSDGNIFQMKSDDGKPWKRRIL